MKATAKKIGWALGFDLSLTAPAAVALPLDWRPGDWKRARAWLTKPRAPKGDDTAGQLERYVQIREWSWAIMHELKGPNLYGIEAYAFSKNNASASKLMELGGIVRLHAWDEFDAVPLVIAASSARKTFLGKVPRADQKIAVQVALGKCKAPREWEENICDAFVVANHMLGELGSAVLTLGDGS